MEIVYRNPSILHGYDRNARTHSAAQVEQIIASITEFGFNNPILVDETDTVIAGHGRLAAALQMGLSAVPCIVLSHLSDAQRRAYILVDNKIPQNAGWDENLLKLELLELKEADFGNLLIGFEDFDFTVANNPSQKLKKLELKAPKLSWVLIGIPLIQFGQIEEKIAEIALVDGVFIQTTCTD